MPMEKHIVSKDPGVYEAWPDVVQTEGGKLICVFLNVNIILIVKVQEL